MTDALVYSLVAGVAIGFAAGYIGSLMVLKRMALVGDAMSHVALPGLALGILLGFNPFLGAFAFLFVAAVVTWYIEQVTKLSVESIVGVLFVLALAIGILLTPQPDLLEALFGDITTVTALYALAAVLVAGFVVVVTRLVYERVVLSLISDELARSTGVRVAQVNLVYLLLVALVVAAGIQIVGSLLVGALVIVPAAAMKNVSSSLTRYALFSGVAGVVSVASGVLLATGSNLPAGPLIVIVGFVIFLVALGGNQVARRA
jgi:zinc transport system permease protein